jgi:hypothetical protein
MSVRRTGVASWLRGSGEAEEIGQTDLLRQLTAINRKIDALAKAVDKLAAGQKEAAKWRQIFRKQVAALLRAQYVAAGLPGPRGIEARRFRLRSQNEEDGLILALLEATGIGTRRFVEIGSGGTGGNSGVLARELGWDGLMIDASEPAARAAQQTFGSNPGVTILNKRVSTTTINRLLDKSGYAGEVDVLSIDIDSFDYWLLEAIEVTTARVLVMEYNAYFGADRAVTVPNAARPKGSPKAYLGASIAALEKCARRKGYRLVLCEESGVNAFFVRDGLAPQLPGLTPQQAFRPKVNRRDVGDGTVTRDLYAEITAKGLPLVEV